MIAVGNLALLMIGLTKLFCNCLLVIGLRKI